MRTKKYRNLCDLWESSIHSRRVIKEARNIDAHPLYHEYPSAYIIEWALSKRSRPDWLDWAIERGLYIPKQKIVETTQTSSDDIDRKVLATTKITDKPLASKERNTLLIIIAALAAEAKIDLTKPSKAGETIAHLTEKIGAPVDHATIEGKIKLMKNALESRAK